MCACLALVVFRGSFSGFGEAIAMQKADVVGGGLLDGGSEVVAGWNVTAPDARERDENSEIRARCPWNWDDGHFPFQRKRVETFPPPPLRESRNRDWTLSKPV